MNSSHTPAASRLYFFDHLRYLVILCVVVLHAALAYSKLLPWWPVLDLKSGSNQPFDIIVLILDVFVMPVMFFIAGYFALSSLKKHGTRAFIKSKLKRLGIPLLIGSTLAVPLIGYMYHYSRADMTASMNYLDYWIMYLKSFGSFHVGYIVSFDQFTHNLYWFLSLLLFFFLIFAALCEINDRWLSTSSAKNKPESSSHKYSTAILLSVGLLTALCLFIMHSVVTEEPWLIIANVLQFQPTRVFFYIFYFALGVYSYAKGWFVQDKPPARLAVWGPVCIVLSFAFLVAVKKLIGSLAPSAGLLMIYVLARSFLCLSFLIVMTSFAFYYWNRPSALSQTLASNSYNIYLLHMVIVLALNLLLARWTEGHAGVKFTMVSLSAILLSLGISQFVLKPITRLSAR